MTPTELRPALGESLEHSWRPRSPYNPPRAMGWCCPGRAGGIGKSECDIPPARPDRWAKAPRRIRLGPTSFGPSTAVPTGPGQRPSLPVRQSRRLGPRDGREGFVPIVAENFAQGGTKAICIDRESLLQLGRYNSYITIAEAAEYLQIGGHTHVSAHGAATMPVLIHQMNQQAPMSGW